jgi:hypothetical protein
VYTVAGLQPLPLVPFVTESEYTLVTVGVAVGLATEVDERPGPLQLYVVAPPAGFAVSVAVPPLHIGPLFVGAAVGVVLTVTDVVYTVDGLQPGFPEPSVTVNEYTVVTVGVAVGLAIVFEDNELPLHE